MSHCSKKYLTDHQNSTVIRVAKSTGKPDRRKQTSACIRRDYLLRQEWIAEISRFIPCFTMRGKFYDFRGRLP